MPGDHLDPEEGFYLHYKFEDWIRNCPPENHYTCQSCFETGTSV